MSEQPVPEPQSQSPDPLASEAPGRPSRKTAWLAMGAVALALGLLMFIPDEHYDPNAPPPSADGTVADGDDGGTLLVGKAAPLHFTLKDMNGVDVQLASFKGKVIVLNFWATWCGPCKVEIPDLVAVQNEYRDDLVILGVSVDDTPDKMKPYAAQYKINYPLLVGNGRDDVQDAYGPLWGIPVSVFIDREGKIAKKHSGIATREQFLREITPLIGGRGAGDDL
jgi:thiol-disulfide isomerase/thioredoxin